MTGLIPASTISQGSKATLAADPKKQLPSPQFPANRSSSHLFLWPWLLATRRLEELGPNGLDFEVFKPFPPRFKPTKSHRNALQKPDSMPCPQLTSFGSKTQRSFKVVRFVEPGKVSPAKTARCGLPL